MSSKTSSNTDHGAISSRVWLLLFAACSAETQGPGPAATMPGERLGPSYIGWGSSSVGADHRVGYSLAFVADRLGIGQPTIGDVDGGYASAASVRLGEASGEHLFAGVPDYGWEDVGGAMVSPGELTGDGTPDVAVALDAMVPWPGFEHAPAPVAWVVLDLGEYLRQVNLTVGERDMDARWTELEPSGGRGRASPCGDLDGDGDAELCTDTGVFLGPVTDGAARDLSWPVVDALAAADLDGDGRAELVLAAGTELHVVTDPSPRGEVALADLAAVTVSLPERATALALADLDGDGTVDLAVGSAHTTRVGPVPGAGESVFHEHTSLAHGADALAVGDFDGDGHVDLAIGGESLLSVWTGPVAPGSHRRSDAPRLFHGEQYPSDRLGFALAAADPDGDGVTDLAVSAPEELAPAPEGSPFEETAAGRVWWWNGLP